MNEPYTKKLLCQHYSISRKVLGNYMNEIYFDELSLVGYRKEMRVLPPKVVRKFIELYGKCFSDDE